MKLLLPLGAVLSLLLFSARADALATYIANQPNSPVQIEKCYAGLTDSSAGNKNYYLDLAGVFQNKTAKDIYAVRYRFDIFNDFHEHLRTVYGTDSETLNAYATMDDAKHDTAEEQMMHDHGQDFTIYMPTWEFININDTAEDVVCSVDTVRFMGSETIWHDTRMNAKALAAALRTNFDTSVYIFHSKSEDEP